jgi:hypothetical protein
MMYSLLSAVILAAMPVVFNPADKSVTFTATATECTSDVEVEFLFVGPASDRAYESVFVTDAPVEEIANAIEKAGIARGKPVDELICRFWPTGQSLTLTPSVDTFLKDTAKVPLRSKIVYTGGVRNTNGVLAAAKEAPNAVFALYNCSQSLIQFDECLEQSSTYGRFLASHKYKKGEKVTFTLRLSSKQKHKEMLIDVMPGKIAEAIAKVKKAAENSDLDLLISFSPDMTVEEASQAAKAFSFIESRQAKINSSPAGQFYFKAFLPVEEWRKRSSRMAQPPEVKFLDDGKINVVEIKEDWSDEKSELPKLNVKETLFSSSKDAAKLLSHLAVRTRTALVFAPKTMKLAALYDFKKNVSNDINTWYVFAE